MLKKLTTRSINVALICFIQSLFAPAAIQFSINLRKILLILLIINDLHLFHSADMCKNSIKRYDLGKKWLSTWGHLKCEQKTHNATGVKAFFLAGLKIQNSNGFGLE